MKKNYIVAIAFAAAALGASAQSKFDAPGAMAVSQAVVSDSPAARSGEVRAVPSRLDNGAKIAFIVTFADEQAVDLAAGYEILDRRDNMAVINLSAAEAMQLAELPEVIELAAGYENPVRTQPHSLQTRFILPAMWNYSTRHSPLSTLIPISFPSDAAINQLITNRLDHQQAFWHGYCPFVTRENETT